MNLWLRESRQPKHRELLYISASQTQLCSRIIWKLLKSKTNLFLLGTFVNVCKSREKV